MPENLKPCPFCGGTPELIDNNPCAVIIYVRCPECQAMIVRDPENAEDTADKDAKQAVIEAWNTRNLTPAQEHAEELMSLLCDFFQIFMQDNQSLLDKAEEVIGKIKAQEVLPALQKRKVKQETSHD